MEIKKIFKLGKEGRETLNTTSEWVSGIIGKTLGPAGRNYFLPTGITNDGKTIMEHLRSDCEAQDQASLAFHEVAHQTDKDAGNGTTSSIIMTARLIQDLLPKVGDIDVPIPGTQPVMDISRALEEEKDKALGLLKDKMVSCETLDKLKQVSFTAMEDKKVGDLVAELMWEGGKDTYPVLRDGYNEKVEKDVVKGLELPFKIATTAMFNQTGRAEYNNAAILVVNHNFEQYLELTPFMTSMVQTKPQIGALVIVAKQFSVPFVESVRQVSARTFPIILVSANVHNDTFEDIASYVDARMTDTHPKTGKKIKDVKFEDTGRCKTFIAREKSVQFVGGKGMDAIVPSNGEMITRVQERVNQIEELLKKEESTKERNQMEQRKAALLGGISTIFVDAKTAAEKRYLKLKIEDTMNSCRGALRDGMAQGAGKTLKEVAEALGEDSLLYNALMEPYNRIILNNMGQEVDTEGIYDAYPVLKANIENSVSVAKTAITIEGIIADEDEDLVSELGRKLENIK